MKRSKFNLSHYKLLTGNMGNLIPVTWYEALPGDTIQQATSMLARVSPLLAPIMHPVRIRIHHWFVPNRLIWEDFEDFITGGPDGTSLPEHPYISLASAAEGSLHDYLGVPPDTYGANIQVSALPFRAYNLIYNEHYRDQDLIIEKNIDTSSGEDTTTDTDLLKVSWEKDYFTTCRPWELKGDEITIPFSGNAPVTGIGFTSQSPDSTDYNVYETGATAHRTYDKSYFTSSSNGRVEDDPDNTGFPNIRADLSQALGIPINDLRLALALQRYQEARAQYGSRYVEYLRYLGVKSSDARMNLPEYLGGGRQVIQFSEVLSTDGANTGDLKGHGIAAMRTNRYRRFFEEHGVVMTLMSVVPKAVYSQSLHRAFSRQVKEDYFQRELQFIGEQEIPNKEVYVNHTSPSEIFGYQARYDEYRYHPSTIAGEFRSTLDHWHMARIFGSDPALNQSFIEATPTDRIYASTATDQLYIMANHSIQARRMLAPRAKCKTF